jgi:hypothetical protein
VVFISLRAGVRLIIEWQMKEQARRALEHAGGGADTKGENG